MSVMTLALRFGTHRRLNSFLKKMLSKINDRVTEVLCHII